MNQVLAELDRLATNFVDKRTGVIEYHRGVALSNAFFEVFENPSIEESAKSIFDRALRQEFNGRLRAASQISKKENE